MKGNAHESFLGEGVSWWGKRRVIEIVKQKGPANEYLGPNTEEEEGGNR